MKDHVESLLDLLEEDEVAERGDLAALGIDLAAAERRFGAFLLRLRRPVIEDQQQADEIVAPMLDRPGPRVLICRPRGPINLRRVKHGGGITCALGGWYREGGPQLDLVIVETVADPDGLKDEYLEWAASLMQQCLATGTEFRLIHKPAPGDDQ